MILTFFICILSVEVFIRSNFISNCISHLKILKKATKLILRKKISDHWKEIVFLAYSVKMIKYSLKMLFTLGFILFLLLITNYFIEGFLDFTVSLFGVCESVVVAYGYLHLRNKIINV